MKNKFSTGFCLTILIVLVTVFQTQAQTLGPDEHNSKGPTHGFMNTQSANPTAAFFGNGTSKWNATHQTGSMIEFNGISGPIVRLHTFVVKGDTMIVPMDTIATTGYFGISGDNIVTNLGTLPYTFSNSHQQRCPKILKTSFGTFAWWMDDAIAPGYCTVLMMDSNGVFSIPIFLNQSTNGRAGAYDYGDGQHLLLEISSPADFGSTFSSVVGNMCLYDPITHIATSLDSALTGVGITGIKTSSDTFSVVHGITGIEQEVLYMRKNHSDFITIPNGTLHGLAIESFTFISKDNAYCFHTPTGSPLGNSTLLHKDSTGWTPVPGHPVQPHSSRDTWVDFDEANHTFHTAFGTVDVLTNVYTPNSISVMNNYVTPLKTGGWLQNSHTLFTLESTPTVALFNAGITRAMFRNDLDLTMDPIVSSDVLEPYENQVFTQTSKTIHFSGAHGHTGNVVGIYDPQPMAGYNSKVASAVVDNNGEWSVDVVIQNTLQEKNYTYKLDVTDLSGNVSYDVSRSFTIVDPTGVNDLQIEFVQVINDGSNTIVRCPEMINEIKILNAVGQVVYSTKPQSNDFIIPDHFKNQVLILSVQTANGMYTAKVN